MPFYVQAAAPRPRPTVLLLDHFDYVVRLIGIGHVGVGGDADLDGYDAISTDVQARLNANIPKAYPLRDKMMIGGLSHPKRIYDLTEGLIRRGYSDENIRAISGGNFQHALEEIWIV